jgi:GTP cyclohydrolase FolE2
MDISVGLYATKRGAHMSRLIEDAVTAIHHHAVFAEDALRIIADKTRAQFPTATRITCQIVNYESVFEYPLGCVVNV